ncbi:MAG: hypothetical protein U0Y82_12060 [Thermoleophilia bacterium]
MTDWATISSLATAAGTLVLAVATFASVRSANRSARIAELGLQEQRRPVLLQSRLDDPEQKIMFVDRHWVHVRGGGAAVEHLEGVVYLALSLRNVGAGIAVLQGWHVRSGVVTSATDHIPADGFRTLVRDLYIPPGDIGLWQGALRDTGDDAHGEIADSILQRRPVSVELMYTDQVGGQRTISRFMLVPAGDGWLASAGRHWYLDQAGPR